MSIIRDVTSNLVQIASEATVGLVKTAVEAVETAVIAVRDRLPTPIGQTTKAASLSVALASDQGTAGDPLRIDPTGATAQPVSHAAASQADGHSATLGATTDAAVTTDAAGTINARLRGLVNLVAARWPALGQALMAASVPVAIASDQSAVPISGSVTAIGMVTANEGTMRDAADAGPKRIVSAAGQELFGPGDTPGWVDLSTIAGAAPSATNYLPARITNGTSYLGTQTAPLIAAPPRQLRDAFERLRVSQPQTLFDSSLGYSDSGTLWWDDAEVSGGGTASSYRTNESSFRISVDNLTAGKRERRTYRAFTYQPGKSQLIFMTGVLGAAAAGITREIRHGDANNAIGFKQTSAGVHALIRTYTSGAAVEATLVNQSSWNQDKLNGAGGSTNPSGYTADWTKSQIFGVFFEALYVGSVWFFVVINGDIVPVHRADHANSASLAYIQTANLPVAYSIENSGAGAAASMDCICSTVISEGGSTEPGFSVPISRDGTVFTTLAGAAGTWYPLIAWRLRSGYTNAAARCEDLTVACTTGAPFNVAILRDPTVGGVGLAFGTTPTGAPIEHSGGTTLNTSTLTLGVRCRQYSFYQSSSNNTTVAGPAEFFAGTSIAGTRQIMVLAVQSMSAAAESFYASANLRCVM